MEITVYKSAIGGPYPWCWRVSLNGGAPVVGVGVANRFQSAHEALQKALDYVREQPPESRCVYLSDHDPEDHHPGLSSFVRWPLIWSVNGPNKRQRHAELHARAIAYLARPRLAQKPYVQKRIAAVESLRDATRWATL